jgi:hypothetical protein
MKHTIYLLYLVLLFSIKSTAQSNPGISIEYRYIYKSRHIYPYPKLFRIRQVYIIEPVIPFYITTVTYYSRRRIARFTTTRKY